MSSAACKPMSIAGKFPLWAFEIRLENRRRRAALAWAAQAFSRSLEMLL